MSRRKKDVAKTIRVKLIIEDRTQRQFADECGIVYSYFSKLMTGKAKWSKEMANRVIEHCPELTLKDFGFKD